LVDASIPTGGLGPMPAEKAAGGTTRRVGVVKPSQATEKTEFGASTPMVDNTPVF